MTDPSQERDSEKPEMDPRELFPPLQQETDNPQDLMSLYRTDDEFFAGAEEQGDVEAPEDVPETAPITTQEQLRSNIADYYDAKEKLRRLKPVPEYLESRYDNYMAERTQYESQMSDAHRNIVALANHAFRGISREPVQITFSESDNAEVTIARVMEIIGPAQEEEEPDGYVIPLRGTPT